MSMNVDQVTSTVGDAIAEGLAKAGVKMAFAVPGEGILGLLAGLAANHVRVVGVRHEASAALMATAAAQLTGRPAACIATTGPGAMNLAAGLQAARADSAPVIAIVGQVSRAVHGREAFREVDVVKVFEPLVKSAAEVKTPEEIPSALERAVVAATRGRPGPVLLAIPADIMEMPAAVGGSEAPAIVAIHPEHHVEPDPAAVRKILHLLADARRPLILAGAGVLRARSTDALVRFATTMRVPVVTGWRRGDAFPNENDLYLGTTGPGASANVLTRMEEADALLVLGCRVGEMTTFGYRIPAAGTRWAQVDAEPRVAGFGHRPDVVIAADAASFLRSSQRVLARAAFDAASLDERTAANAADRRDYEVAAVIDEEPWGGIGVHPGRVVATLARILPQEAILTTDSGDFGQWVARGYRFNRPGTFLGSSAGPLGYGLPAAVAAALARPGRFAVALTGDGGFATTMAEMETAVRERAHVLAVVFDNGRSGRSFRQAGGPGAGIGAMDFAAVAEACGALGISVRTDGEFEPALHRAMAAGRPALLHLTLDPRWTTPDGGMPDPAESAEVAVEMAVDAGEALEAAPQAVEVAEHAVEAEEVTVAEAVLGENGNP
ncbi:MAG TPA: thiamine pyrophosphate-binding protein [Candidatus Limnocylindrales bacterium]